MGLVMAYKNFDPKFNVKFSTYAYSYILGEMKKVVNENNNLKYSKELLSLKYKIDKVSVLLTQKLMRIPTKKEIIEFLNMDYSSLIALKEELKKLNKEEKALINSRYMYGLAQREVASNLNTNQVDVSRREKKILLKLKTSLKS